jgi:drug/metabolite transporter (DMT)-like permease
MLFAFATTILFSFSAVFATRSIRTLGPIRANFARLLVACVLLGLFAHTAGHGVRGSAFWWYFLSGVIGFGLGDLALFLALPRIGSRLTVLLTQCLAAPFAAVAEWTWLGTRPTLAEAICGLLILAGVGVAIAPRRGSTAATSNAHRGVLMAGLVFGVFAAVGQGGGAVVSRHAAEVAEDLGEPIDGMSAAYQRILGGILFTSFTLLPFRRGRGARTPAVNPATVLRSDDAGQAEPPATGRASAPQPEPLGRALRRGWGWVVVNALAGPVLGVACFQTALLSTPSGIVLPIVALTPITVMPLAWFLEHDRPQPRALVGAVLAVAGAVALTQVH